MTEDGALLRQYAQTGSEEAFSELVHRHLPLVYSAAVRQVHGNTAMAKDVSQNVFIDLARKARSLAEHELLAGWLYTSTRMAASKAIRTEQRRQLRERIAVSMHLADENPARDQTDLMAVLDEAMGKLAAGDRNVLLMRFFQAKDLKTVGAAIGVSEDAARMRVTRALNKLHSLVTKKGVGLSAAGLGTLLTAEAVTAAPAGLAASISAAAVTSVGASAGTAALVKLLTLTKLKAGIIGAVVVAGVVTPFAIRQQTGVPRSPQNAFTRSGAVASSSSMLAPPTSDASAVALSQDNQAEIILRTSTAEQELRRSKLRAAGARLRDQTAALSTDLSSQKAIVLSKVALLKAWLREMPEKGIPEIQFCTEADWLDVVDWAALDDETGARKALLGIRNLAKRRFEETVLAAVQKYSEAHQQLPANLADLNPFLDSMTAKTLAQRYELSPKAKEPNVSAEDWVINEKSSVDNDYDALHHIGVYGIAVQPTSHDSADIAENNN